jgi:hypothetical protein
MPQRYPDPDRGHCWALLDSILLFLSELVDAGQRAEVFAGNTHDSRTLQTIVATMEARHGLLGRVWITDRGMASVANLAWLRDTGRRYIIGAPKSELKKFGAELAGADGWRTVHEGVEVKLARHPETDETVIPCRSADRRSKERAMHDKFSAPGGFPPCRSASRATGTASLALSALRPLPCPRSASAVRCIGDLLCRGLILQFRTTPSPRGLRADDSHLLLALAAMLVQSDEQHGSGGRP